MSISHLLLVRDDQTPERTYGKLWGFESGNPADEVTFLGYTLEEPWRGNQHAISCIPAGIYKFRKMISLRLGECFAIDNVPDRSAIRIHAGNRLTDTEGCVLVGRTRSKWADDPVILYSRATLAHLLKVCAKTGTIEIVDGAK